MSIIKSKSYSIVNDEPFDLPLPLNFELWYGNTILVAYEISEKAKVTYSYNKCTDVMPITSTSRKLEMRDIYFLFTSRVFKDKTPYTSFELERFGLIDYNQYQICRRTHGMLLTDKYWIKFPDDGLNYKEALEDYQSYYSPTSKKKNGIVSDKQVDEIMKLPDDEILNILKQHKIDFTDLSKKTMEEDEPKI